jgi:hypothetical protein
MRAFDIFQTKNKEVKIHERLIVTMTGRKAVLQNGVQVVPFYLWAIS